jgi:DNA-binding response OmpR family regulator
MRVLIVEDDLSLSTALQQSLRAEGYATDVADNGVDGEHLGMVEEYDAIILDLGLPTSACRNAPGWRYSPTGARRMFKRRWWC